MDLYHWLPEQPHVNIPSHLLYRSQWPHGEQVVQDKIGYLGTQKLCTENIIFFIGCQIKKSQIKDKTYHISISLQKYI